MKRPSFAPKTVPRLNSLLHRLQQTPGPKDEPYLDQLMMFLDDPPPDVGNRWVKGAEMCAAWGIATSHGAVHRLFQSYAPMWRARLALESDAPSDEELDALRKKIAHLITLRITDMLANPSSAPATLVSLARLEFARQKHIEGNRGDTERALAFLGNRTWGNWEAQFAIGQLRSALGKRSAQSSSFATEFLEGFTNPKVPLPK